MKPMQAFMLTVLVASTISAPDARAQEAQTTPGATAAQDRQLSVSAGVRIELGRVLSPGGSLGATWYPRNMPTWFSLQFHGQMSRKDVPGAIRRDHLYFGRFLIGYGRGDGPSAFVFMEVGSGVIKHDPDPFLLERTYGLWGIGVGLAYTLRGVTGTLDASSGGINRVSAERRTSYGVSAGFRLF